MAFRYLFFIITVLLSWLCPSFVQGQTILRHGGSVQTVKFSPVDNSLIASAGDNTTIKIWDLQDNTIATTLRGHRGQINSVAFSPDGTRLASGSNDWTFRLWDVETGAHIATLEHIIGRNRSAVIEVAFSPDGELLATAGMDVKLWEVSTQNEIGTLQHNEWVVALAFSPNGELLATGDNQGNVNIWDVQAREVIAKLEGDTVRVDTLVFSPDGRTLASAGYHGLIKLWAVSDWTLLGTLQNRGTAYTLDFSPDGKALVSTGHGAVTLWSVESGEEITTLTGHSAWVFGAAFSPDGRTLASGGDDGTVRVQNIESYLQTLQQREMVRLIYFLPINRTAQQDIDAKLDTLIRDVQRFYAEQMNAHGFGRKTFTFETDAAGNAVVHHVNGKFTDAYYDNATFDKVLEEIEERFSLSTNLYLISIDTGSEKIDVQWCGLGGTHGTTGGRAIVPASGRCFIGDHGIETAAHELGHAFGLEHDFRNDAYMMSYGDNRDRLSYCAAEWLDVHRYFNNSQISFNEPTTIVMHPPIVLPSNAIRFRFEVTDTDGLHQAQFVIPTAVGDPADGIKLHSCKLLNSEIKQIEFTTTELTVGPATEIELQVIDINGFFTQETFPVMRSDIVRVDINNDGVVNVTDLCLVASSLGTTAVRGANPNPDVNRDGFVNREDLLLIVEVLESEEPTIAGSPLQLPEDVNADGIVNIIDLTLVASNFGKTGQSDTDINKDGVVNIIDLTLVAAAFGNTAAAPEIWSRDREIAPTRDQVQQWLRQARQVNLTDPAFQRGLLRLEQLLTTLTPKATVLLPNYPNPFNPETWIPYQLAEAADVTMTLYAADGRLVRTLNLGHQDVGIYESRSRAAYWDGKNALGEPVASGVYFYTLTAGDFTATRKMLIRK